jgi:hypothetical protein
LDDLILIPLGIVLALKMIPSPVLAESRKKAQTIISQGKPVNRLAAVIIISIWLVSAIFMAHFLISWLRH